MVDEQPEARPELARWIVVALVIGAGIVMFFLFAPDTPPAVIPIGTGGA
jgi:hypothetical protein